MLLNKKNVIVMYENTAVSSAFGVAIWRYKN